MAEAGWYPDPQDPRSLQYFDGSNWTGARRPLSDAAAPARDAAATTQNPRWAQTAPQQQQWGQQPYTPQQQYAPQQHIPQQYIPQQYAPQQQWNPHPAQQQAWGGAATPPARRSRKGPLIAGGVVVVAALAAVLGFVVLGGGDDAPKITYQGKALANGDETLTKAETSLAAVVQRRHGASNADTRCYFVQPTQPDAGQKKTDIQSSLRCGPVLFVDGNPASEYVAVSVTGTVDGNKATLTAQDVAGDVTPAKLDDGVKLIRPDGKTPPEGTGGLSVPAPPAADKNVITVATLGDTTKPGSVNGVMVGLSTRVTITSAGTVPRYGTGDAARSAPAGQKLLAFQVSYGPGEGSATSTKRASLVVDGASRTLPLASDGDQWIVAAVPTSSSPVLQLVDGGITQTLSLPDGKPGPNNAQVLLRKNTTTVLSQQFPVPFRVADSRTSVKVTVTARASNAELSFWPPGHEGTHASSGSKAILFVRLNYTDPTQKNQTFGFDPPLLRLRLPSGQIIPARNIATDPTKVYNVFEVPADFTTGQVQITGSEKVGGTTVTVITPRTFTVTIPAG